MLQPMNKDLKNYGLFHNLKKSHMVGKMKLKV